MNERQKVLIAQLTDEMLILSALVEMATKEGADIPRLLIAVGRCQTLLEQVNMPKGEVRALH